jgi:hypothetical protein
MWILYICVISATASGMCVGERLLTYPSEASCKVALAGARVETGLNSIEVGKATSVEIAIPPSKQVLILCRPK